MPTKEKKEIKTSTGILIILAAAVIIGGGAIAYFYASSPTDYDYRGQSLFARKSANKNANINKNTNTATKTESWKTYNNTKYGFQLTFTDPWKGYKIFETTLSDGSIVLYVAVPTEDGTWKEEKIDAGYASLFAIDVLTPAQWAEMEAFDGPKGAYITKNDDYVFVWSPAQAAPQDLMDAYGTTLSPQEIIDTFKLN